MELDLEKAVRKKKAMLALLFFALLTTILGSLCLYRLLYHNNILFLYMLIACLLWIGIALLYNHYLKKHLKEIVLRETFEFYHLDYYNHFGGIKKGKIPYNIEDDEFKTMGFVSESNYIYKTTNLLVGKVNETNFRSVDVSCQKDDQTYFKGRLYAIDIKAPNDFKLLIKTNCKNTDLTLVEGFTSKYQVYTNDRSSSYVNEDVLRKLFALEKTTKGALMLCIQNGSLYVGKYDNLGSFDIPSVDKWDDFKLLIENEISFTKGCVHLYV